jgi:hypothetical protein
MIVFRVAIPDRRPEQLDRSLAMASTPRPVRPEEAFRGQGVGAGRIVVKARIVGLPLQGRFELRERFVLSFPQFRGHHDGEVELESLRGIPLLELR